jgi:D-alanyl-D-alanine carboxypeptidase (penicillin-binding protein 5/6)
VLGGINYHTPLPPGSLSKIMTALVAVGWLPPNSVIPVTAAAANVYPFRIGMKAGQKWSFSETLRALLIYSANDAAYSLAQRVSGSLARFGATMRLAASQMGMRDHPMLHDPAGLDGTEGVAGGNRISAWDLAVAARDLMANRILASIVAAPALRFTSPGGTVYDLQNQNLYFLQWYPGAIGVKTGLTDEAGFCVIEEAARGGRHMMAVVLGGSSSYQSAADLLDEGFAMPVAKEPRTSSLLPGVTEPHRPARRPVAAQRSALNQDPAGVNAPHRYRPGQGAASGLGAARAAAAAAAPGSASKGSLTSSYGMDAAIAGAVAGAAALVGGRTWRRRRKGIGAHSAKRRRAEPVRASHETT